MTRTGMRWRHFVLGLLLAAIVAGLAAGAAEAGEPPPNPDGGTTAAAPFQFQDDKMKEAFRVCMETARRVAGGDAGNIPGVFWHDVPGGIDRDLWNKAIDNEHWNLPRLQHFTFDPRCDRLLPDNYEVQIAPQYYSEVYRRCRTLVDPANGPNRDEGRTGDPKRPQGVPAYWWFKSLQADDCFLLLPMAAFGLEGPANSWDTWTTADEIKYPTTNTDPKAVEEYHQCQRFVNWRMDNGMTANVFAGAQYGLDGKYQKPQNEHTPMDVWREALDFTGGSGGSGLTLPGEWMPKCELVLVVEECRPSTAADPTLLPEQCVGTHALANYDINYDQKDNEDDTLPSISRNLWGGSTNFAFYLAKGGVQVALWAVDWAFEFKVAKYNIVATTLGNNFEKNLINQPGFRLQELCWLILFSWAGMMALRGKLAMAGSEILMSIVMLIVATVLLANRQMYMNSLWRLMDEGTTTILVAGMGGDPSSPTSSDKLVTDIQRRLVVVFIEDPYDYLNWKRPLGDPNDPNNEWRACAAARYYILSRGPHGTDDLPRKEMAAAGEKCAPLAEWNRDPTGDRLLGAVLLLASAWAAAILLILMGLTVVAAKFTALAVFGLVGFGVPLAIVPSGGRRLLWSGVTTAIKAVGVAWGVGGALSITLLGFDAASKVASSVNMIERFAMMNLLVLVGFSFRRKVIGGTEAFASRFKDFMSATRGSGAEWATAGGGGGGWDGESGLLAADRPLATGTAVGLRGAAIGTVAPAVLGYRFGVKRLTERRVAQRSYKNLQRLAYWKRRRNNGATLRRWKAWGKPLP